MSYQLTTTIIGLILAGAILYMVRRDHLHGTYALWWLGVAIATVILGFDPKLIDQAAALVGVNYGPTLLFTLAIGFMLVKMLRTDVKHSKHERRIRRLAQKVSILSEENRELRHMLDRRQFEQQDEQLPSSSAQPDHTPDRRHATR